MHGLEAPTMDSNDAAMIERLIDTLNQSGTSPRGEPPFEAPEADPAAEKEELDRNAFPPQTSVPLEQQKKPPESDLEKAPLSLMGPPEAMFDMTYLNGCNELHALTAGVEEFFTDDVDLDQLATLQDGNLGFPEWTTDFTGFNAMPLGMTYGWVDLQVPYPDMNMSGTDHSLDLPASAGSSSDSDVDANVLHDDECSTDVINEISERIGSLQVSDDGELRYFGATSNLILRDDIAHFDQLTEPSVVSSRGQLLLDSAGLGHKVDASLEDHLTNLYFTWQDPTFHVVDRELYKKARGLHGVCSSHSSYLSETLINAM